MRGARFEAVVFDLFGTLVNEFPRKDFYDVVHDMARELGADPEAFEREWADTAIERQTGRHPTVTSNVQAICERLGVTPEEGALERAMEHRDAMYVRHFRERPAALETLRELKARRYPTALVSMCAPDAPALWRTCPLSAFIDVEVFSSEVGLRKPDPEIYLLACDALGVDPAACLYVGDGAYGELTGAAKVGMHPVLIRDPSERPNHALRLESEDWDGDRIGSLGDVLEFLDGSRS